MLILKCDLCKKEYELVKYESRGGGGYDDLLKQKDGSGNRQALDPHCDACKAAIKKAKEDAEEKAEKEMLKQLQK